MGLGMNASTKGSMTSTKKGSAAAASIIASHERIHASRPCSLGTVRREQ